MHAVVTLLVALGALGVGLLMSAALARRRTRSPERAEWARLERTLSPDDRRAVQAAVREGRAVPDERLRRAAVAMAQSMLAATEPLRRPSRWRRVIVAVVIVTTTVAIVGLLVDHEHPARHIASIAANGVFALGVWASRRLGGRIGTQAMAAVAANGGGTGTIER
jgi:hypothetical protein